MCSRNQLGYSRTNCVHEVQHTIEDKRLTITSPLHHHCVTITSQLCYHYIPLCYHYITIMLPLHNHYVTITSPLHRHYVPLHQTYCFILITFPLQHHYCATITSSLHYYKEYTCTDALPHTRANLQQVRFRVRCNNSCRSTLSVSHIVELELGVPVRA